MHLKDAKSKSSYTSMINFSCPVENQSRSWSRHLSKVPPMSNECMKGRSVSLVLRKMPLTAAVRCPFAPTFTAAVKTRPRSLEDNRCLQGRGELGALSVAGGRVTRCGCFGKRVVSRNSVTLRCIPQENGKRVRAHTCTQVFWKPPTRHSPVIIGDERAHNVVSLMGWWPARVT